MDIQAYLDKQRDKIDGYLSTILPDDHTLPKALYDAMRYSLLGGGKRIRPILTLAAAESVGFNDEQALLPYAASLELIHTYSLIHDDLPAMDNDDYRRGRLTNHKVFGEGLAVLAGDALLTMAFELCSRPEGDPFDATRRIHVIHELAVGAGHSGMVGGQVLDIQAENQDISLDELQTIHTYKTGRLIRAAVRIGGILGGATPRQLECLTAYAEAIGLAFQIADDVLNLTGTREELGKDAGTDAKRGKKTYPAFYGIHGARQLAEDWVTKAITHVQEFGPQADPLRALAGYIVMRRN